MAQETVNHAREALERDVFAACADVRLLRSLIDERERSGQIEKCRPADIITEYGRRKKVEAAAPQKSAQREMSIGKLSRRDQARRWAEIEPGFAPLINDVRRQLFQQSEPQFTSDEDAATWCRQQRSTPGDADSMLTFFVDSAHRRTEGIQTAPNSPAAILRHTAAYLSEATLAGAAEMVSHLLTGRAPSMPTTTRIALRLYAFTPAVSRQVTIAMDEQDVTYQQFRTLYERLRSTLKLKRQKRRPDKVRRLFDAVKRAGPPPSRWAGSYWEDIRRQPTLRTYYETWRSAATAYDRWKRRAKP
jgi:hypothetical protein